MPDIGRGEIFYDYLKVSGGAERVALELAHYFDANLYVGYEQPGVVDALGFATQVNIRSLASRSRFLPIDAYSVLRGFLNANAISASYDWSIYSGTFAPLAVFNRPSSKNIMYCHTPPRYIYGMRQYYHQQDSWLYRRLRQVLVNILQPRYEAAIGTMDLLVANSYNVQSRIKHYLGRESVVIYPPCDTEHHKWSGQENYYLSTARLEPYKRVDRLVKAFLEMPDKKLIVSSSGSEYFRLKRIANNANNILFTGWISDKRVRELISKSIATLYIPIDEDFGMSPVESMAAGKPVIGVQEGGIRETVLHDETGILLEADPSIEMIIDAVEKLTLSRAIQMRDSCEQRAKLFSRQQFFNKISQVI